MADPRLLYGSALQQYIRAGAQSRNLDPAAVLAVASTEGGFGLPPGNIGDRGKSFGPFQLYRNGRLPAVTPQEPSIWANTAAGIDYALDGIAAVARGLRGNEAINAIVSLFEHPADIPGEIRTAQARYRAYGGGSAGTMTFVNPTPQGTGVGTEHDTSGIGGYQKSRDFFAPAGSPVVAPETMRVYQIQNFTPGDTEGNVYGAGFYAHGQSGEDYYITHLGEPLSVRVGMTIRQGQPIGTISPWTTNPTKTHVHIGALHGIIDPNAFATGQKAPQAKIGPNGLITPCRTASGEPGYVATDGSCQVLDKPGGLTGVLDDAASGVFDTATAVPRFLAFLLSVRFLQLLGGGLLILIGLYLLAREAGISPPLPGFVGGAASKIS